MGTGMMMTLGGQESGHQEGIDWKIAQGGGVCWVKKILRGCSKKFFHVKMITVLPA